MFKTFSFPSVFEGNNTVLRLDIGNSSTIISIFNENNMNSNFLPFPIIK